MNLRKYVIGLHKQIRRLNSFKVACQEWSDKTDWVQKTAQPKELGRHRANVIHDRFDSLREENESLRQDAMRFRWLRLNGYDTGSYHAKHEYNASAWFEHLDDAAIDAAIFDEISSPENPS